MWEGDLMKDATYWLADHTLTPDIPPGN